MSSQPTPRLTRTAEVENLASPSELLRLYRLRSGLTQDQLARQLGFETKRMVKKWEGSLSLPEPDRLKTLIKVYLEKGTFLKGQEYQEIFQLWHTIKYSYEATPVKARVYPHFDHAWFAGLAVPGAPMTLPGFRAGKVHETLTKPGPNHNLPVPVTTFIGREKELEEIARRWSSTRCLTLIGMGGIGKTRLALEVAGQTIPNFPDGVWFIELAALTRAEQVAQTVARTLNITEKSRQPLLTTLTDTLKDKQLLIILDNCEHLFEACADLVTEILGRCLAVKIMATSRERLKVTGELSWRVPALEVPAMEPLASQKVWDEVVLPTGILGEVDSAPEVLPDAVKLLVERVRAIQPGFKLTSHNAPTVSELCRQLDGLPLAIELAAVRTRMLSIGQINARLAERFRLLTGGSVAALPRQQTLKALIDWSYDLLEEKEQKLLVRLAVFVGNFSLEAVEAVCAGEGIQPDEVAGLLLELIARSLVTARLVGQVMHYSQLETIRLYGQVRLKSNRSEEHYNHKHFNYYLDFLTRSQPAIETTLQYETALIIEQEYTNCHKALIWSLDQGDKSGGLKLGQMLNPFWELRSVLSEGRRLIERGLGLPGPIDKTLQAQSLISLANFCELQGSYEEGVRLAQESLEIGREAADNGLIIASLNVLVRLHNRLGNNKVAWAICEQVLDLEQERKSDAGIAIAKSNIGNLALNENNYVIARQFLLEALELNRRVGNKLGLMANFINLGILELEQGNYETAWQYTGESVEIGWAVGNRESLASGLMNLGIIAHYQGDYDKAKAYYLKSLPLHLEVGSKNFASNVLINLGEMSRVQGDYPTARRYTLEGMAIQHEIGDKFGLAISLNNLGNIATNLGDYLNAQVYCQESVSLRQELNNKQGVASCYLNLGDLALLQTEYLYAHEYYLKSLVLYREIGDVSTIVTSLVNLALVATKQGQEGQAREYLLEAVELGHKLENPLNLAVILAVTAIFWSGQSEKTSQIAALISLVEALLFTSGGVLERIYLLPYHEVTGRLDTNQLASGGKKGPELTQAVEAALNLIAREL